MGLRRQFQRSDRPLVYVIKPHWYGWGLSRMFGHRFPPMPLLVLAALAEREGWDARIIDESYEELPAERPDLVMVTVWTGWAPRAYQIADDYRAQGVPVVLGGVHASLLPTEAMRHADAVVGGEAERVMGEVLADAANGRLKPYYHGPWAGMEHAPMADELIRGYEQFPYGRYQPTHTMQATRGCRFNCDYCSVIRINGRGSRHADVQRVIDDIRVRQRMKPRLPGPIFVFFLDDDMASDLDYAGELFEAMVSADVDIRWTAQASIGLCRRPELLALAARSGCRSLFCGFESVSRDALLEANKKNRPSEYKELVARAHENGIAIESSFIFGFDEDRPDVFDDTIDTLHDIEVDLANFFVLTPFPGTHTFARYYEEGRILDFDWGHYNSYTPVVEPQHMSVPELREGLMRAYRKFYAPAKQRQRFRNGLGRRDWIWSMNYALINRSYGKVYRNPPQQPRQPAFQAHPDDLELLLTTSKAEAQDAIKVAAAALPASAVPLTIGPARGSTFTAAHPG